MKDKRTNNTFGNDKICFSGFLVNENESLQPSGIVHNHITLRNYYDLANLVQTGWIFEQADGTFEFAANWSRGDSWSCTQEVFGDELYDIFNNHTANGYGIGSIRYSDKDGNITVFHPSSCKVNGDGDVEVMYFTGRYFTDGSTFEEKVLAIQPDGTFEITLIVQP